MIEKQNQTNKTKQNKTNNKNSHTPRLNWVQRNLYITGFGTNISNGDHRCHYAIFIEKPLTILTKMPLNTSVYINSSRNH